MIDIPKSCNDNDNTMIQPDLSVNIAGVQLDNPVIAASGTFGYGREYEGLLDISALGAICTKGLTLHPRTGNSGIRLHETASGLINSIGLENPGIAAFIEHELPHMQKLGPKIIANLSGSNIDEYREGAVLLSDSAVDLIELNISCPNVKAGGMAFGLCPTDAAAVVRDVKKVLGSGTGTKPLIVKLSPNAPDLCAVAAACEQEGADALSLVNTFKALAIDINTRSLVFDNITAGLSGPAIKPIALRMVWEVCAAARVPVIGMGGIASTTDALEFLAAGAAAIQVGAATFMRPTLMNEIVAGIEDYMRSKGFATLGEVSIR